MGDIPYIGGMVINELGKPTKLVPILVSRNDNNTLARAYLGVEQTGLVSTVWTKVLLDTESYDIGNNFSSYKYVCPVSGKYQVNFNAGINMAANHILTALSEIRKNNSAASRGSRYGGPAISWFSPCGGDAIDCAAGDYLELWAYSATDSGTANLESDSTFMSVHLIST